MARVYRRRPAPTPEQLAARKRIFGATFVTCLVVAFIAGTVHVLTLGSNRLLQMRSLATYNVKDENNRIRAAGEEITRHQQHEHRQLREDTYSLGEVKAMLTPDQWKEVGTMELVPAGEFIMGTNQRLADAADTPQHRVSLPAFLIDKYPVTNAQYALFLAKTGHLPPLNWHNGRFEEEKALYPVTMVTWYDAMAYAKWAGKRLPTEAEWEKAARGTDGRRWPWGNIMDAKLLNTYYTVGDTSPVTKYSKGVSPYGLFDMAGNVAEWTADDFLPYPGSDAPDAVFHVKTADIAAVEKLPRARKGNPHPDHYKVLRGGSWKSDPFSTETYHRNYSLTNQASNFFGFRTAEDANGYTPGEVQSVDANAAAHVKAAAHANAAQ